MSENTRRMQFCCSTIVQHRRASLIPSGYQAVAEWLRNRKVEEGARVPRGHRRLERRSSVGLYEAGHVVSLVNPMRIKAFAKSEMLRPECVCFTISASYFSSNR